MEQWRPVKMTNDETGELGDWELAVVYMLIRSHCSLCVYSASVLEHECMVGLMFVGYFYCLFLYYAVAFLSCE